MTNEDELRERFTKLEQRRLWAWTGGDTHDAVRGVIKEVLAPLHGAGLDGDPISPREAGLLLSREWLTAGVVQGFDGDPLRVYVRATEGVGGKWEPQGELVAHPVGLCPACQQPAPLGEGTTDRGVFAGDVVVGWPGAGHRAVCPLLHSASAVDHG